MMSSAYHASHANGLPNPSSDPQFYARVPYRRLVAWIIDSVIIVVLAVIAALIFGIMTLGIGFIIAPIVGATVSFTYRCMFLATKSATPGMMVMGIEFRTLSGARFELKEAAIHTLAFMVVFMTFFGQVASAILMGTTEYGRGLPDLLLGSTAINRPLE